MAQPCCKHLSGSLDLLLGLSTFTETVLETTRDVLEVAHTAGTGGLSTLSLDRPVEGTDLGRRITARSAGLLLVVEGALATTSAESVRLGVTLTERGGTLGLMMQIQQGFVLANMNMEAREHEHNGLLCRASSDFSCSGDLHIVLATLM